MRQKNDVINSPKLLVVKFFIDSVSNRDLKHAEQLENPHNRLCLVLY